MDLLNDPLLRALRVLRGSNCGFLCVLCGLCGEDTPKSVSVCVSLRLSIFCCLIRQIVEIAEVLY